MGFTCVCVCVCVCAQLCSAVCDLMNCSPAVSLLCPWNFPGKNMRMGCID